MAIRTTRIKAGAMLFQFKSKMLPIAVHEQNKLVSSCSLSGSSIHEIEFHRPIHHKIIKRYREVFSLIVF